MAGVNKVILVGRLGKDPEVRNFQNGGQVVSFSLATSERFKDRDGQQQERTQWHNVAIFNEKLGEVADKYLRKGSEVYVEGQLETRKWKDNQGEDRYTTEVVLRQFRGELALIGGRRDNDNDRDDPGTDEEAHGGYGGGRGDGGYGNQGGGQRASNGGGQRASNGNGGGGQQRTGGGQNGGQRASNGGGGQRASNGGGQGGGGYANQGGGGGWDRGGGGTPRGGPPKGGSDLDDDIPFQLEWR